MSINFQDYNAYYSDELFNGNVTLAENSWDPDDFDVCINYSSDYLNLFNSDDSVSFVLSNISDIYICDKNQSYFLNITMDVTNSTSLRIIFHEGNYSSKPNYYGAFRHFFGAVEQMTGFDSSCFAEISNSSYSTLKNGWNVPSARDFSVSIANSTDYFLVYNSPDNVTRNVYGKEYNEVLIDSLGNSQKITLNLGVW